MRPSYFSTVLLQTLSFDDARRAYVEWIVGAKRFDRLKANREDVGIDTRWNMRALHQGGTFLGRHDARVATRRTDTRYLLRMVHRDRDDQSVLWHNVVDLMAEDGAVRVSHAVARSGPPGAFLPPKTGAPNVLRRLLRWNGHAVEPTNIGDASSIRVGLDTAEQTVRHLVLAPERATPLVVMTPRREDGRYFASPTTLANRLAGMCRVLELADDTVAGVFTRTLQDAGFPRQFATLDGAVRLFLPRMTPEDSPYDHRLWTRARIESFGFETTEAIAGQIAETAVRGTIPQGFFEFVERHDQREAQRRVEQVLAAVPDGGALEDLARLREEHAVLRGELEQAAQRTQDLIRTNTELEEAHFADLVSKDQIEQQRDELAEALRLERGKSAALQAAIGARRGGDGNTAPGAEVRTALRAVLSNQATPSQCLLALEQAFGDRVVVLPSARTSAQGSDGFKYSARLWELLLRLAGPYHDKMSHGSAGDGIARTVFGDKFAAKESETTMGNARAKKERTFRYEGDAYVMWRHLKIGVADNTGDSIRVHFEWLGDRNLILVGHCGAHLYLPLYS